MALKYFNIKSKETVIADTEPKIAALWGSSDRSPNVSQGQDFGWRLAPEVIVELKEIKGDIRQLRDIATDFNVSVPEVTEHMILQHISAHTLLEDAPVAEEGDYTDEYNEAIRQLTNERLKALADAMKKDEVVTTTTTTESLADLEKRVALQERLAAAKAALAEDTSDTIKGGDYSDTTTTTTSAPSGTTTTTTTKKK